MKKIGKILVLSTTILLGITGCTKATSETIEPTPTPIIEEQEATPTPAEATTAPDEVTPTPEEATPTPKPATPTPKPATPTATPTPKPATPTPKPATPTPKPATPTPKPATPTPSEPTDSGNGSNDSSSDIITKVYEQIELPVHVVTNAIDPMDTEKLEYNTGLKDGSKIKEVAVSEPMMSSQAYSYVVVKVKDSSDTSTIANEMLNGINPSKWICVTADELKVATCGDTIMLIMFSSSFHDYVTTDQIVEAFADACNGTIDEILE